MSLNERNEGAAGAACRRRGAGSAQCTRNAPALDAQIELALDRGNDLILDVSEASFIDSSVIHLVARAAQTAQTTEQTVVLQLGTAAIVERVLEVSGIEEVLPRAHDRREALLVIREHAASV